jgi:hemoglobin
MAREDLCTEQEITTLVHEFYARVRADNILGPIFDAHISDWPHHLAIMVRFWSSVLLGSGTYSGTPMPKHVALPGLEPHMFNRWLDLFHETTETLPNRPFAERAEDAALRIARSLWFGYQMNNHPDTMPKDLHRG